MANTVDFLDNSERLEWNNPREIVAAAQIRPGARIAEIGCGTGWFSFELERATRPRGMVYALDKLPAMLQILETKRQNYERILTLPCGENDFELDDGEVDVIFHANVLHECENPELHLKEAYRVLKNGGRIVVIEWTWADEESQPGPPNTRRLEVQTTHDLLGKAGFSVQSAGDVGPYHYVIIAQK
ncbi:ubiquinone/menaquinone biosynthesis C-methyltransferase UbiE [Abditibacteriota bacterium]|nr:ubiquinone/menaquinone biosynthesis C-methyltransferase UbiE [Abditibacteriota bacterium]